MYVLNACLPGRTFQQEAAGAAEGAGRIPERGGAQGRRLLGESAEMKRRRGQASALFYIIRHTIRCSSDAAQATHKEP